MFLSKHRLNIAPLRIGKHRIAKKSEHRRPLGGGVVLIAPHVIQELYCPVLSIIVRTEQFYNTSCVSTADQNLLLD